MIGRMSRWTPSRETSGPWPDSRPATLSISSMKMMPICSARSTATRVTWSMSRSLFSSSWIKYSKASATLILRFFFCWPNMPESMFLILTSISSTPWLEMISNGGMARSRTSRSTIRWSSLPSRSWRRSFSRVRWVCSRCAATSASGLLGAVGDFVELFLADHVDGSLDEIADHRFHIAADVADFRVFRSFDLDERAAGQARQAARDFRFSHAGGANHQNIFRQNVFRDFRWKLLAADSIAQSHGDGALRRSLPDDVLVELRYDFARRHVVESGEKFLPLDGLGAVSS